MSFPQHKKSWPPEMDVVTSTKRSRGHDILSGSHDLICRGHDKTK